MVPTKHLNHKNIVLESICRPYRYFFTNLSETGVWIFFIVIGGLLGTIINIITRCVFGDLSVAQSLYIDSKSGSFYTYALVMVASVIGPFLISLSKNEVKHFAKIKVWVTTISIFLMIFIAIFYSFKANTGIKFSEYSSVVTHLDCWQLIFFILSILISIYWYGVSLMDKSYPKDEDLETYAEAEQKIVDKLEQSNLPESIDDVKL